MEHEFTGDTQEATACMGLESKGGLGSTRDVRGIRVKFTGKAAGEVGNNLVVFTPPAESTVELCYYLNKGET